MNERTPNIMTVEEKLIKYAKEADQLASNSVTEGDSKFSTWRDKVERFLVKYYGNDKIEHTQFNEIRFHPSFWTESTDFVPYCRDGLIRARDLLYSFAEEVDDDNNNPIADNNKIINNSIFLVYGRDLELKASVENFLEELGIDVVALDSKANFGKTIIEKIEKNSNVGYAICLFSSDDEGRLKGDGKLEFRPRQNVIFEAGYFIGRLGRENIIVLADPNITFLSDLNGLAYISTKDYSASLLRELKNFGLC